MKRILCSPPRRSALTLRAREGFPIAAPATWSSIEAGIRPDAFTMKSPFRARSDPASRPVRKRA
jgi:DNA primase